MVRPPGDAQADEHAATGRPDAQPAAATLAPACAGGIIGVGDGCRCHAGQGVLPAPDRQEAQHARRHRGLVCDEPLTSPMDRLRARCRSPVSTSDLGVPVP
jgi:hypothetical protein